MNRHETQWTPCPPGEVQRLVGRLRRRRQWQTYRGGAAVAARLVLGAAGYWTAPTWESVAHPPKTCQEVIALAPDYFAGRLDRTTAASMRHHLDGCRACREHLDAIQGHSHHATVEKTSPHLASSVRAALPAQTAAVARLVVWHD
jgi:hypothetical protein